jgi:tetratricopeptide (TPR) repeat protein
VNRIAACLVLSWSVALATPAVPCRERPGPPRACLRPSAQDRADRARIETLPPWAQEVAAWVAAAWGHQPGRPDADFGFAQALEPLRLEAILADVRSLRDRMIERPGGFTYRGTRWSGDELQRVLQLTGDEVRKASLNRLLERGAVLHADVAMLGNSALQPAPPGGRRPVFYAEDGQHVANDTDTYHWTFAYALLDAMQPGPGTSSFARAWYIAAGAYFDHWRHISAADRHYTRARQVFPADAELLFRGACALETLASPETRAAIESVIVPRNARFEMQSTGSAARHAEDLFRAALASDPGLTEARLRLARLLAGRGEHQQARDELTRVLAEEASGEGGYLAELFLGHSEDALGRPDPARAAYERAASICPSAQSPLLGLARLEHRAGNRDPALAAMARLWKLPAAARERVDPWFEYYRMQGRDVDARLEELYRATPGKADPVSAARKP